MERKYHTMLRLSRLHLFRHSFSRNATFFSSKRLSCLHSHVQSESTRIPRFAITTPLTQPAYDIESHLHSLARRA